MTTPPVPPTRVPPRYFGRRHWAGKEGGAAVEAINRAPRVNTLMQQVEKPLTPLQDMFVREYLIDLNGSAAAIRAGYKPSGAGVVANQLLKAGTPTGDAIARAMAARAVRVGMTADNVLRQLGRIVNGDPRCVFREDGALKAPEEMDDDDAQMIAGVKTSRAVKFNDEGKMENVEIVEVKLVNKLEAINMAMRHLGMFNDKLDINVTSLAQRMADAERRVSGEADPLDLDPSLYEEVDEPGRGEDLTEEQHEAANLLAARQQADDEIISDEEIRSMME